jgi:hypothetical protein
MLYSQVSTKQNVEQEAGLIADQYFMDLEEGKRVLENQSFDIGEMEVVVKVNPYQKLETAVAVQLVVFQKEDVLYSAQKIILTDGVYED